MSDENDDGLKFNKPEDDKSEERVANDEFEMDDVDSTGVTLTSAGEDVGGLNVVEVDDGSLDLGDIDDVDVSLADEDYRPGPSDAGDLGEIDLDADPGEIQQRQ